MKAFEVGQLVRLATHPEMVFEIVEIHGDRSYQIQLHALESQHLSYDNVPAEMLRAKE
ncbi:hypothetical protein [Acinetobacter shaoyimingii]|uniref:DUF2158 domain-containing protein n=1 Tax=Acinetobacter shaoyimingii TaxID=2715164 RepID=A0A6G8RXN1_9GAMM|nr:hypothetical protein [Acinetobacter shaoyimingii]QIO06657.1 hypothetical protein G8E00_12215 [Acinetobacter shaoyimingii]